jgi:hypothetical protein
MSEAKTDKPDWKRRRWKTIGAAILATYSISGFVLVLLDELHWLNREFVDVVKWPFMPLFLIVFLLNTVIESIVNR